MFNGLKSYFISLTLTLTVCFALSAYADFNEPDQSETARDIATTINHKAPMTREETHTQTQQVTDSTCLPTCSQCQAQIPAGNSYYHMRDGRNFCSQECYKQALPKCSICSRSFENGFKKDGYYFCSSTCLEQTYPQCQSCRKLTKMWSILSSTNEVYCPTCLTYPKCFSCTRPTRDGLDLRDGRHLCPVCRRSAITQKEEAAQLLGHVRTLLKTELAMNILIDSEHKVAVKLCNVQEFRKKAPNARLGDEPGIVLHKILTDNETAQPYSLYEILILNNLSREKFIEVAAHELAVLWLKQNYPNADNEAGGKSVGNPQLREGFGEWVASRVNAIEGREKMNIRMQNNKSQYWGNGYRMIKGRIEQFGFDAFKKELDRLSQTSR